VASPAVVAARLRAAASPAAAAAAAAAAQPARAVSNYYGVLERHVRGGSGANGSRAAPHLTYVDQLRAEHILKTRMHLGHQKRKLNPAVSGAIHGFRHNVAVFDVNKTWRSLRTLFYGFAEMAQTRSSFFLLAPNPNLPLKALIERLRNEYPFRYNKFSSLYMAGYADRKWVDGLFSNWKVTFAFHEHMKAQAAGKPEIKKYRRYERYLRGVDGVDLMAKIVPDFVLVFAADRGAFHEAANADVPLVGLVDSNMSPAPFLYPVFGNDDSIESVGLVLDVLKRGVEEGRKREHEAFATMLLRKIKARLDPAAASEADGPGVDGGDDPAFLRELAASVGPGSPWAAEHGWMAGPDGRLPLPIDTRDEADDLRATARERRSQPLPLPRVS
jgi:small subunit ribosomal protein S2